MTLVVALLLLNFLIFIHELAHLLAAQWLDTPVEEFSLGVGPQLWSYTPSERSRFEGTEFVIRWIPIGGFVKMAGQLLKEEDQEENSSDSSQPISPPSPGRHLLIALAGPLGSVVAMFLLFVIGLGVWGNPPRPQLDGFTRYDAARFEPSFATAIQATSNPTIFVYTPSSAARVEPTQAPAPNMGLPISSPLAPWEELSMTETMQRAGQATRQATILLGEMMLWLAQNPKMFAQNVGSPFGVVEGAQRMAASSSSLPRPSPMDTTEPDQIALADTAAASSSSQQSSGPAGSSTSQEEPEPSPSASSSPSEPDRAPEMNEDTIPAPDFEQSRQRRVLAPADSDSAAQAGQEAGEDSVKKQASWSWPSVDETRGYGLVFFYLGLLSVFIAYLNLTPIPPFDGFQVVVSAVELVSQRRVPRKARLVMSIIGAVVVIYILTQGIINDLQRRQSSLRGGEAHSRVVLREVPARFMEFSEGTSVSNSPRARSARLRIQRSDCWSRDKNPSPSRACWVGDRSSNES